MSFSGLSFGLVWILLSIFSISNLLAEPAGNTYRGTISLQEPRALDLKDRLNDSSPNYPENLKLFFQGLQGNYAVFYDWNGHTVYYKYRDNKFDRRLRKYVSRLAGGAPYEVSGEYMGVIVFENKTISKFKKKGEDTLADRKEKQSIPVFQLTKYRELILEEIIF
ncbi:LIC_11959 family protein [Leptospira langatensis]|uniref:LIC_11959 family protein n=1 Tax=Leptospira langatensis TaxID=2484983 RepID=UPI003CCC58D0